MLFTHERKLITTCTVIRRLRCSKFKWFIVCLIKVCQEYQAILAHFKTQILSTTLNCLEFQGLRLQIMSLKHSVGSWRAEALHLTSFFPTSALPPHLIIQPISLTSPLKYIEYINFSPSLILLSSSKESSSLGALKTTNFISLLPGLSFHRQFSSLKLETAF